MNKAAKVLSWLERNELNSLSSESTDESSSIDYSADERLLQAFEIVEVSNTETTSKELVTDESAGKINDKLEEERNVSKKVRVKKIPSSHRIDVGVILKRCQELYDEWNEKYKDKNKKIWKFGSDETSYSSFSSHGPYMDDILLFCLIYNFRGTSLYNIKKISTGELKEVIEHLAIKYQIPKPKKRVWYPPESVTLERVVRAYPDICCDLYAKGKYKSLLTNDVLGVEFAEEKRAFLCPLFPSVACTVLLQRNVNILPELLWLAYKYDEKITKNLFDLKALWRFLVQSLLVHLIPEEIKLSLCKKWKLVTIYDEPEEIFSKTRPLCMEYLENEFGNHKDWPKIKNLINNYSKDTMSSLNCDRYVCLREDLKNILNKDEQRSKLTVRKKKTNNRNKIIQI